MWRSGIWFRITIQMHGNWKLGSPNMVHFLLCSGPAPLKDKTKQFNHHLWRGHLWFSLEIFTGLTPFNRSILKEQNGCKFSLPIIHLLPYSLENSPLFISSSYYQPRYSFVIKDRSTRLRYFTGWQYLKHQNEKGLPPMRRHFYLSFTAEFPINIYCRLSVWFINLLRCFPTTWTDNSILL